MKAGGGRSSRRFAPSTAAVAALLALFVVLFPVTRPEDPDVWFHLAAGRHLWTQGEYPGMEQFLYTFPEGVPSFHHEWLFQAVLYPLYRLGGMEGLVAAKSLLLASSFLGLFFFSLRRGAFYPSLLYFLLAFGAGSGRFYIRPEVAGAACLALMWPLLNRPPTAGRMAAIAALQVLWTNLHWSSILGVAVVGAFAAADLAGRLLPLPRGWDTGPPAPRPWSRALLLSLTALATLVNPDGLQPYIEPLRYFSHKDFLVPIAEILPIHAALSRSGAALFQDFFFYALALGTVSFIAVFRRINAAHLLVFAGLAAAALSTQRHVLFFSLLSLPIVSRNISQLLPDRDLPRLPAVLAALVSVFVLGTLTLNKVTGVTFLIPYPKPYEPLSAGDSPLLWPHRAADFLLREGLPDRIFNNFNSGNFLCWALPSRRIYRNATLWDRRVEVEYAWIKAHPAEWDSFADAGGVETVFFRLTPLISPAPLLAALLGNPRWRLVYYDGTAAVLLRDSPENRRLLDRLEVDLARELRAALEATAPGSGRGAGPAIWRDIALYRERQDLARLFRLRGQFYLLAGRPDLAAAAADVVKSLEG